MQERVDTGVNPMDYFNNIPNSNGRTNYRKNNYNKRSYHNLDSLKFDQPKMIGYFSVNEYREFVPDASKLRYLKRPKTLTPQLDLNIGLKEFRPKPESVKREKMDFFLRFIVNNAEKFKVKNGYRDNNKLLKPDVICSRGRLVQIMCQHYLPERKWSVIVSKYKGNIYICQPDGDDFHTKQTIYGFKFEQYLLTENPLDEPKTNVPVIESEEFYGVFESQIGNLSLLYNAEIDGLDSCNLVDMSEADLDKLKFVELKTCQGAAKRRYCWWWGQAFLANISNIIVGYRTKEGIVTKIDNLPTEALKSQEEANWSPDKCLNLLKAFMNNVHFLCRKEDSHETVYKFDYDQKLNETIQCTIFKGKNEYSFLPDWYIDEMTT